MYSKNILQNEAEIKTFSDKQNRKFVITRLVPQNNKVICEKPRTNIIFNSERLKVLALRSRAKEKWPRLPLLFNTVLKEQSSNARKEIKGICIGNEKVKLSS